MKTQQEKDEQRRKLEAVIRQKAGVIGELMNSHVGKELIRILDEMFGSGEMRGENPYDTYFHLGQRDVVEYLKSLRRIHDKTSEIIDDAT